MADAKGSTTRPQTFPTFDMKTMLGEELDRARSDATDVAYAFIRLCEAAPQPGPDVLEEAATEMMAKAGRVAGFAHMLAREVES